MLVNTVNTVGVMGKGIAKEFKAIYPEMFQEYLALCESGELRPGRLMLYRTPHKWTLNFLTKRHWRQKSKVEDIEAGLKTFTEQYETFGVHSFAIPQLGYGNGELDWETQVRPLMERYLESLPIEVYIHTYDQSLLPEHREVERMRRWLRSEPNSLAFSEFWEDVVRVADAADIADPVELEVFVDDGVTELEPALRFDVEGKTLELTHKELFEFWQVLRTAGVASTSNLADRVQSIADQLFVVLQQLPYVAEVSFASVESRQDRSVTISQLLSQPESLGLRLEFSRAPRGGMPLEILDVSRSDRQLCLNGMTA